MNDSSPAAVTRERPAMTDAVEVAYREVASPVGTLLLAATPAGLVRVAFADEGVEAVLQSLTDLLGPNLVAGPGRLDEAARQLAEYFGGRRTAFDLPLDLSGVGGFRRDVLDRLAEVPFGRTVSYAALAARAGRPRAVRAVGSACAANPLPIVIGCHRVVRSDGGLGGYAGGLAAKRFLLELERRPGD